MAFDWSVPVVMLDLGFCGVGRKTATLCILLTKGINKYRLCPAFIRAHIDDYVKVRRRFIEWRPSTYKVRSNNGN